VRSITHDRSGALWVGTYENGANRIDSTTGTVRRYKNDPADGRSLSHDRVRALFQDATGRVWVGTSGGLDLYDPRTDSFDHYVNNPADPHSLADDHVMSIAADRGGMLWVGTRFGGAHKWHPRAWQFGHRPSTAPSGTETASPSRVTAFTEDRAGRLWVGAFGEGVALYDRNDDVVERFHHDPSDPRSLSSARVTAMFTDHDGDVWVGTLDGGINRYDADGRGFDRFVHDEDQPGSLAANGITSIVEDADGTLWVGTFGGGVDRLDRASGTFAHFRHSPDDPRTISNDRITSVAPAANGLIWVGTHGGGVSLLDPFSGRASRFVHDPDDPNSLGSDLVYFVFVDARGGLWAGTTGGLSHLAQRDVGSGTFRTYRERDGLPNNVVYSIQQDRTGRLWFSTNRGLGCLDPETDTVRSYDRSDGLQDLEFNFGAGFTRRNGQMLFGGINGFNSFVPERLVDNEHEPPVVVVSAWRDHEPVEGPADQISRIDLDYRQNVVSFEFAALDYDDPSRNQFSYRLDGFDRDWVESGSENRVTYTNLDPGHYELYVRAANSDGVWNTEGLALEVVVESPPWQTPWAYGGYTFGVLSLLFGFVQVQRRRVAREEEYSRMLEEQVQHRTRELADRTHELETVNRRLATASLTDSLTGFANRRFLIEYLEKEISLVKRRYSAASRGPIKATQFDLAFMMIDLDDFKSINDTFGHSTGDEVLRQLRTILENACRSSDIVIRWGGDEFLVIARDQDATAICALAERIRNKIATHAFHVGGGRVVRMTCSIGYACYPFLRNDVDALTWEQVIGVADRALYVSKRSGRNAWVGLESTETADDATLLAGMRHQLERLVRENQLKLHTSIDRDSRTITWTLED
jgi:diguanylate cyclase (GGDEF)-like protein